MLEITNVKFFFLENQTTRLKAIATITFNDILIIKNFKVVEGSKGLFLGFPSERVFGTEQYFEIISVIDSSFKKSIQKYVLEKYKLECSNDLNPSF